MMIYMFTLQEAFLNIHINMINSIIALMDYKGLFGSNSVAIPHKGGMNKELLSRSFEKLNYRIDFKYFNEIDLKSENYTDKNIIYTSSEDIGYQYKSYIEDVVYSLELSGANVMPNYKYLKANNNKAFMELLGQQLELTDNLKAQVFGSMEDLLMDLDTIEYPIVFKVSGGSGGAGVALVKSENELIKRVKGINKRNYYIDFKDYTRTYRFKGYTKESVYRRKFILQQFIPNLKNDWKVLVFGDKFYIFKRPILEGRGIKASGGGLGNYFYGSKAEFPEGLFDFVNKVFTKLDIPHLSIDVAFDGKDFYIIEYQALYFGTSGVLNSDGYFTKKDNQWDFVSEKIDLEEVYANSIVDYINKKRLY